jgi:hypothetical protein
MTAKRSFRPKRTGLFIVKGDKSNRCFMRKQGQEKFFRIIIFSRPSLTATSWSACPEKKAGRQSSDCRPAKNTEERLFSYAAGHCSARLPVQMAVKTIKAPKQRAKNMMPKLAVLSTVLSRCSPSVFPPASTPSWASR